MPITPGPWTCQKVGRNYHITLDRPDRPPIAWVGMMDTPSARANAHLMAAAPELLDAAKEVIANWEKGDLAQAVRKLSAVVVWAERR